MVYYYLFGFLFLNKLLFLGFLYLKYNSIRGQNTARELF